MTCREAQDLMLEADLDALRGDGSSDLARHIAGCAQCRGAARRILDAEAAMHGALEHLAGREHRRPAARGRGVAWRVPAGMVAAAAVLTAVAIGLRSRRPALELARPPVVATDVVEVDAPVPGQTVAVFRTADPSITVVWFFQN